MFDKIGCAVCHVRTMSTAAAGTKINGGAFTIPPALGGRQFHPFGDFLLHDLGTSDGIAIPTVEHYGRASRHMPAKCSPESFQKTRNRVRTAPLWGVRLRTRLMHDGATVTLRDAILRHAGEAEHVTHQFRKLPANDADAVLEFLRSL